jgi:hypothetical protein
VANDVARAGVPDWLGGTILVGAASGPLIVATAFSVEYRLLVALKVLVVIASLWPLGLLTLVAPFGNFKRTRVLLILWPVLGVAYMVDMAWRCGIGLARVSRRIRVDHPDERTVTMTGHIRQS